MPLVSILMPVYNAERYLRQTLKSIQAQTHTHWELIAVDDWSDDRSFQILKQFSKKDTRIKPYRNGRHRGVAGAANLALSYARGKYIARMDADDVMYPQRLEKQVQFLQKYPQIALVGTQCSLIDEQGKVIGTKSFPLDHENIYEMLFYSIPMQQPTLMFNFHVLPKDMLHYDVGKTTAEEVELLFRVLAKYEAANMAETLHSYRLHQHNTSLKDPKKTFYLTLLTRWQALFEYGYTPTLFGVAVNCAQLLLVTLLPKKYIVKVFYTLRDMLKGIPFIRLTRFSTIMNAS